jgi:hypothetical protein
MPASYVPVNHGPVILRIACIFLNVVARGGTVRWNRHITPDFFLATSWLHDLIYTGPRTDKRQTIYNLQFSKLKQPRPQDANRRLAPGIQIESKSVL